MSEEQSVAADTTNATAEEQQTVEQSAADKIFDGDAAREPEGPGVQAKAEGEVEAKSEEGEVKEDAAKEPEGEEAQYEFAVDDDEPITDEQLSEIAELAKANNLSNEEAQKLVDMQSAALKGFQEKLTSDFEKTREGWKESAKTDPEIGGENFGENVELAKRVIDRFASEEFKTTLNDTGFGNHPDLLKVFVKIGKAMANDSLVMPGSQTGAQSRSPEDIFYPTTAKS